MDFFKKLMHPKEGATKVLVFNFVIGTCLIGLAFIIVVEAVMKYEQKGLLVLLGLFMYLLLMFALIKVYAEKLQTISLVILYPLNLLVFPYMFLHGEGGGVASGMPIWITFGLLMTFILVDGWRCYLLLGLTLVENFAIFVYAFENPSIVNHLKEEFYYYEDNLIAIIVVSISIGFILKYQLFVERKQNEVIQRDAQRIRTERNNAIKANRAKITFLTNISHDIRTPLTDILGEVSIASENLSDPEEIKKSLAEIEKYSMELLYLFNNTLDLAEIEADALRIKENRFYVPETLAYISAAAERYATLNKVSFEIHKDENMDSFLVGDTARMRQIMLIILENGFKYTHAGGHVSMEIERMGEEDELIWYRTRIKDTGIGMTQEFIEDSLFEPYVRGTDEFVRKTSGSGIGMSIALRLVEAMNGRIKAESQVNVGTTITVDIPMKKDTLSSAGLDSQMFFRVKNKNVIVVDDDEISKQITEKMLEKIGADVKVFSSAEAAIEELQKSDPHTYDLLIMDIQLPGMDGYAAARTIRSISRADIMNIPMIALTANAYSLAEEKTIQSGMNDHIAKPIDVTEFYQKIYRYLVVDGV